MLRFSRVVSVARGAGPGRATPGGAGAGGPGPARALGTSARLLTERQLAALKKQQVDFQVEDGRPVFLKRGFPDRLLYTLTVTLAAVGLFNVLLVIYDQAKPPSWRKPC